MIVRKQTSEQNFRPSEAAFHSFKVYRLLNKQKHPHVIRDAEDFKRYSRQFNIDMAAKILFSKSSSVDNLITSQVASYLEFNNVNENFFYNPSESGDLADSMVKIPFSKSEIFTNQVLTLKEKRQLVKAIEMCLTGTDLEEKLQAQGSKKSQNSTHEYDKDISLSEQEQQSMKEMNEKPIMELMNKMGFEKRLVDILLYAIGMINKS